MQSPEDEKIWMDSMSVSCVDAVQLRAPPFGGTQINSSALLLCYNLELRLIVEMRQLKKD